MLGLDDFLNEDLEFKDKSLIDFDSTDQMNMIRLQEENKRLSNQVIQLREQFDEAMSIQDQMNAMQNQLTTLSAQNSKLQNQNEDLNRRLQISLRSNSELSNKYDEETKKKQQQFNEMTMALSQEIDNQKVNHETQISDINAQLEQANNNIEKERVDRKTYESLIERTIQSAQRYFDAEISTLEDLISIFDQQRQNSSDSISNHSNEENANSNQLLINENQQLHKTIKKLKLKVRNLKQDLSNADQQFAEFQAMSIKQSNITKQQLSSLATEVSEARDSLIASSESSGRTISALQSKVNSLKSELARVRSQNQNSQNVSFHDLSNSSQNYSNPSENSLSISTPSVTENNQHLLQKIDVMNNEINNLKKDKAQIMENLIQTEKEKSDLRNAVDATKTELQGLEAVHEQTVQEVASLRKALHTKSTVMKTLNQIPIPTMNPLQPKLDQANEQIKILKQKLDNAKQKIDDDKKKIEVLTLSIEKAEEEALEAKKEIEELGKVKEEPIAKEEEIPSSVWNIQGMPIQLQIEISNISNNSALQLSSKIQSALKAAVKSYNDSIDKLTNALQQERTNYKEIYEAINQFMVDISISIQNKAMTLEEFTNNGGKTAKSLVASVNELRQSYDNIKYESEQFKEVVNYLIDSYTRLKFTNQNKGNSIKIKTEFEVDPKFAIDDLINELENRSKSFDELEKRAKKFRKGMKEVSMLLDKNEKHYNSQINEIQNQKELIEKELFDQKENNRKLKNEMQKLQARLNEAQDFIESANEDTTKQNEEQFLELKEKYSNEIIRLKQENEQIRNEIKNINGEKNEILSQNERMRKILALQKAAISEKENEVEQIKALMERKEMIANDTLTRTKSQITASYENVIKKLSAQSQENRKDVEKLAGDLAIAEGKNEQMKQFLVLSKENQQKLICEIENQKEQAARDRQLLEGNAKAQIAAIQIEANKKVEEQKIKCQESIRQLITFAIDNFKQFFSPSDQIDERSYKKVIGKAKNEMNRLISSDSIIRRMVKAADRQTTQDAIAQLLM